MSGVRQELGAEPDRPRKEGDFASIAMGGDSFLSTEAIRSDHGMLEREGQGRQEATCSGQVRG